MPLYEYSCAECAHRTEVLQRLGEGAEGLACPRCGSERMERQLSSFSGRSASGAKPGACSGPT